MKNIFTIILSQPIEIYISWFFRIGVFLLIFSLFIPEKGGRFIIKKKLHELRNQIRNPSERTGLIRYLDGLTEKPFIRNYMLEEDSFKYAEIEDKIIRAGITNGLTPNILRLINIGLPIITFIILSSIALLLIQRGTTSQINQNVSSVVPQDIMAKGFFQSNVTVDVGNNKMVFMISVIWVLVITLLSVMMPNAYLNSKIKKRETVIQKELPGLEMYIAIILETKSSSVYEVLETLRNTTKFFRPHIEKCLREYGQNYKKAIQNMADSVKNEEFQIVCNALIQAGGVETTETTKFINLHLLNLRDLYNAHIEEEIKMRPLYYTFLLAGPLFSVLCIWLLPWLVKAVTVINNNI